MAASIALEAIGRSKKQLRVLDPMAGSGTVVAVAKALGHRAVGIDFDPLAALNARVWTRSIDQDEVNHVAKVVLHRAKNQYVTTAVGDAYPREADLETKRFVRYWFDQRARRELNALATTIRGVRDVSVRETLLTSFSRLIITKQCGVSRALDLSHSRPHRVFEKAPVSPFERFLSSVEYVSSNCLSRRSRGVGPIANVMLGDCRQLRFHRSSFDLVVTSPPYLNAIDYLRCSKFSLVWMGYRVSSLRRLRSESIGSECTQNARESDESIAQIVAEMGHVSKIRNRTRRLLAKYVCDMAECVREVARVVRTNGIAVFVLGDNQIGDVFISNSNAVRSLATRFGLTLESEYVREVPPNKRYLPPPSVKSSGTSLQSRIRTEVILRFRRRTRAL